MKKVYEQINQTRKFHGFLTIDEIIDSISKKNIVHDPFSLLISNNVMIGEKNIFYPNTTIISAENSKITIGNSNLLFNGTHIETDNGAEIIIGDNNVFNVGPVCIKCNMPNAKIRIHNNSRYDGRINIFGNCNFGSGSQILGTINVYSCNLEKGGDFTEPNPEKRAGLIKGIGTARNLIVEQGMVINGFGNFEQANVEPQLNYHKK